jgi:hypothetical protein
LRDLRLIFVATTKMLLRAFVVALLSMSIAATEVELSDGGNVYGQNASGQEQRYLFKTEDYPCDHNSCNPKFFLTRVTDGDTPKMYASLSLWPSRT